MVFLGSMFRKKSIHYIHVLMTNFEVKVSQRYFIWSFAYEEYRTDDSNSPAERTFSPAASSDKMKT